MWSVRTPRLQLLPKIPYKDLFSLHPSTWLSPIYFLQILHQSISVKPDLQSSSLPHLYYFTKLCSSYTHKWHSLLIERDTYVLVSYYVSVYTYADGKHTAVSQFLRELRCAEDRAVPDGWLVWRTKYAASTELHSAAWDRGKSKYERRSINTLQNGVIFTPRALRS